MSLPPDEIRHKVIEELQRRGTFSPLGYIAGMTCAVILIGLLPKVPELMESWGVDWTYKWFTQSAWNRQEFYAFYFMFILMFGYLVYAAGILAQFWIADCVLWIKNRIRRRR